MSLLSSSYQKSEAERVAAKYYPEFLKPFKGKPSPCRPEDLPAFQQFLVWRFRKEEIGDRRFKKLISSLRTISEISTLPLTQTSKEEINRIGDELKANFAGESAKDHIKIIRLFDKYFYGQGKTNSDLVSDLTPPKFRHLKVNPNTLPTWEDTLSLIKAANSKSFQAFLAALKSTGSRPEVLATLKNKDIYYSPDENGEQILYIHLAGKGDAPERDFPILHHLGIKYIREWKDGQRTKNEPNEPFFVNLFGDALTYAAARKELRTLVKKTGYSKETKLYSWRDAAAYDLVKMGLPHTKINYLMGWRQGSAMLERYLNPDSSLVIDDLKKGYGFVGTKQVENANQQAAEFLARALSNPGILEVLVKSIQDNGLLDELNRVGNLIPPSVELEYRAPGANRTLVPKKGESGEKTKKGGTTE